MPSFNGYDGWSCWGRRYNETGEDDDQGENSIWFAWGPSGALLGPYSSRAACVAALIADVEGEKKKAKARHLEAQRRELFDWRKNELRERRSGVEGKGVSVSVDLGGRRSIKKKRN